MDNLCSYTQKEAVSNLGGQDDDIKYDIKPTKDGYQGIVHTDFEGPAFVEFGTGRKAEMPHIGKTYTFRRTGFYFWYAPADKVSRNYKDTDYFEFDGEMFPMNAYMDDKKYVMVFESDPKPFMRPAFVELENNAERIVRDSIGGK